MKTAKEAYYHQGLFLFSEKGWPVKPIEPPQYIDFSSGPEEAMKRMEFGGDVFGYEKKLAKYQEALSLALKEAIPYEDQEGIADLAWRNDQRIHNPISLYNWKQVMLKEGLYSIPEQEVQKGYQYFDGVQWVDIHRSEMESIEGDVKFRTVARLKPSSMKTESHTPALTLEEAKDQVARDISLKTSQLYLLKVVTTWDEWIKEYKPSSEFIAQANLLAATLFNQSLINEVERLKKRFEALHQMYESSVNTNVAHTTTIERLESGLAEASSIIQSVYDTNEVPMERIKDYLGK